ncbi:uncharacterized protein [Amphiura filiformis]|uniref:uncharacterized protein n=1 Tax=Amphiura filiformis TaxID=82378 RepID=UPI003B219BD4
MKCGRKPAKLNLQLQVALSKQPISNEGMRQVLLSCDINAPCTSSMQKTSNKVMDSFVGVTQDQLKENRIMVNQIMVMRHGKKVDVIAQTDTAYNNPPKGRSFYQPGTQAWAPVFCSEPGLERVVLAFETKSKLCSCVGDNHLKECQNNFPMEEAMGNAEHMLGKACAKDLETSIGVRELISDGDSHAFKGFQEIMPNTTQGNCTFHLTKTISRNIMKIPIRSCNGKTLQESTKNKISLAKFIEKRCSWEFRKAYDKHGTNITKLTKPPPGLPRKTYVDLTKAEETRILRVIENKLGKTAILRQREISLLTVVKRRITPS